MKYTGGNYLLETIVKRHPDAHKGDFGKILIFAGSPGMAGAAALCGRSALNSGAGLVSFLLPSLDDPIYPILQVLVPEATCTAYDPGKDLSAYAVIAAGSGLGRDPERLAILSKIIETYKGTLVLDADALNFIAANKHMADLVHDSEADIILTPHSGEAKRLSGRGEGELYSTEHPLAREDVAKGLVEKYNCIVILKGAHTIVAQPLGDDYTDMYQNTSGNPGMATAGSGDVLTGVIAGIAAQKYTPMQAARIGVYIQGLAGDLAAQDKGEMGMTSMDIVHNVPYALKAYYR